MDYSSDENISGELGKRPPRELESPSKIQKSSLLLESTRERTAAKKEQSIDVKVLEYLKDKGRIISNKIAGKDKKEKDGAEANKSGLNSIVASLRQDEKGGQAGLQQDTINLNSLAAFPKQEYIESEQDLKLDKTINFSLKQLDGEAQVGLKLEAINLNSITTSIKQENAEAKGGLEKQQRTLGAYTNHLSLLLIYVKKMKTFPEITKGLSFKAPSNKKKTLCRGLAPFLQKVYTQPLITIVTQPIFDSASDELIASIRQKIVKLLQQLSPSAIRHYENIAALLQIKLAPLKMRILKEERGFGYQAMFKIDILSIFFYRMYAYDNLPQRSKISMIIPFKPLYKIFDIQSRDIFLSYKRKFQLMQQILIFDYQDYFHDEITFLCLINLKNKMTNLAHNIKKNGEWVIPHEKDILQKTVQPAHINSKQIGFKFSEIVDITFRNMAIETLPPLRQLIIFDKVEQLVKEESINLIKIQLIKIALEFGVSLKQTLGLYTNMKVQPYFVKFMRKSCQVPLKESLERVHWIKGNKKCKIYQILNIRNHEKVGPYNSQPHKNPKIQVLCEVAREKYIRLDRIQWCLLNIERQMTNKQPIHISKHEFSFNKIKNNTNQKEDLRAVLILATKGPKQILFKIIAGRTISNMDFINILVAYLQRKEIKGFPLIISEFTKKKFLPESVIITGMRNFKKFCNSQVYFSNNPVYFLVHLLLVEHINMLLHNAVALINQSNFHEVVEQSIDFALRGYRNNYLRSCRRI